MNKIKAIKAIIDAAKETCYALAHRYHADSCGGLKLESAIRSYESPPKTSTYELNFRIVQDILERHGFRGWTTGMINEIIQSTREEVQLPPAGKFLTADNQWLDGESDVYTLSNGVLAKKGPFKLFTGCVCFAEAKNAFEAWIKTVEGGAK